MKEFRVGVIGFGQRGQGMFNHVLNVENVKVTAVCDFYEDRAQKAADVAFEKKGYRPEIVTTNYSDLINSDIVDVIMIFAAW